MNRTRCWFHLPPFTRSRRKSRRRNSERYREAPSVHKAADLWVDWNCRDIAKASAQTLQAGRREASCLDSCRALRLEQIATRFISTVALSAITQGLSPTWERTAPSPGRAAVYAACSPPKPPPTLSCPTRLALPARVAVQLLLPAHCFDDPSPLKPSLLLSIQQPALRCGFGHGHS